MLKVPASAGLLLGLLLASATAFGAPPIQGTASVIDGDTIDIRGERIRLDAIDAPESSQLCIDAAGKRYVSATPTPF